MQIDQFREAISTFSDPGTEILYDKQRAIFSVNGMLIDVLVTPKFGDIFVTENDVEFTASSWVLKRLANLPLLASRLIEQIPAHANFVSPAAKLLPSLESSPDGNYLSTEDALSATLDTLSDRSPFETSVLYVTSDAGEGKTSLINAAARAQAQKFSSGESDWLLVPIILGGRHFLRFDDITVGALQNKYRFPFLYYNSFLTLVRMGVVVPAFDGFEEMFVENSSGEALSAMGILVGALNSTGSVVVAARKAYFEFENLKSQEKLYDTISKHQVGFSKLELSRWERKQFLAYCANRNVKNAEKIYERVSDRLGSDHSLLTRPVLVRRLVDIAEQSNSLEVFLEKIHDSGADFFSVFVHGIIDREATEKWVDRSGEVGATLLSSEEHCELLSLIAINMWESRVDYLKRDHLEVVAEYFCEFKRKPALQSQQILERVRGHALLIASPNVSAAIEFDHDEFRQFFLGNGLADLINPNNANIRSEVHSVLRRGILPENSQQAFIRAVERNQGLTPLGVAKLLLEISKLDGQASYTQENCGSLLVRLISRIDAGGLSIQKLSFGIDCLRDCNFQNVEFENCYFAQGSLEMSSFNDCSFRNCNFGQIRLFRSTSFMNVVFEDCIIEAVRIEETGLEIWQPASIKKVLSDLGITMGAQSDLQLSEEVNLEVDEELTDVEKLLRYFMRSTHISESVIKIKLGDRGQSFIDHNLPDLMEVNVVKEIENRGGINQRRFKLGLPLQQLNASLVKAQGSYETFLNLCSND